MTSSNAKIYNVFVSGLGDSQVILIADTVDIRHEFVVFSLHGHEVATFSRNYLAGWAIKEQAR